MKHLFADARLETSRLIIRPFVLEDATAFQQIVSHKEVMRFLPEDVMELPEIQRIIAWVVDCYPKNTPQKIIKWTLAIVGKQDGGLIGWCGLGPLDFSPGEIELFYGLTPQQWGRGIATEAAGAVLEYGFTDLGQSRIVAVTHPENAGSVKVLEKLGMTFRRVVTGLPEEHWWYHGCHYYDRSRAERQQR